MLLWGKSMTLLDKQQSERKRILEEYQRRDEEVKNDLYAPWQPDACITLGQRKRMAAKMLHELGVFPEADDPCLEVGCGYMGWMSDLLFWGVKESSIYGIELDGKMVDDAKDRLPAANLMQGDATEMPFEDNKFKLIISSTVFTSILDNEVRKKLADEIYRVLAPGGALLCYDFAFNNPKNPNVRKISRKELKELFPDLNGNIRSLTLAPPIARVVAPRSIVLAYILQEIPFLQTHLMAVLKK